MNIKKANSAVSEVLGTIMLLMISITIFSIVYISVFTITPTSSSPIVNIIGTIEGNTLILEHRGGEPLDLDTTILLNIGDSRINIKVGDRDYLDEKSKADGTWNIGERLAYSDKDITATEIEVKVVDIESNSVVMMGNLMHIPMADISIEKNVDNLNPAVGDTIEYTITLINSMGNANATDIEVKDFLPNGLTYIKHETTHGDYDHATGIWKAGELAIGEFAFLNITAKVEQLGTISSYTQLALILDGSSSIEDNEWNTMVNGLADAIEDPLCFPHNDVIELTVIQFGGPENNAFAQVEIEPITITDDSASPGYFKTIAKKVRNLKQIGGYTPTASGIYLAADTLRNSINFSADHRQVINLVTDGMPNHCSDGSHCGEIAAQDDAEDAVTYLINKLEMTSDGVSFDMDEFDAVGVKGKHGENLIWLKDEIVWPKPGVDDWPPSLPGWVHFVTDIDEFVYTIDVQFKILFGSITNCAEKIYSDPMDPNDENNKACVLIILEEP